MSFAISTVLLFIIVAPGLVARFCYFTFPFANKVRSIDFITEVFWSVIPGFIIQFLGVALVERFSSFRVSFPIIGALLMGTRDGNDQQMGSIMDNIHHSLFPILLYNLWVSWRQPVLCGDNPWDAHTLEWFTTSPPPHHNYTHLPPIRSERPTWDYNHPDAPAIGHGEGRKPREKEKVLVS